MRRREARRDSATTPGPWPAAAPGSARRAPLRCPTAPRRSRPCPARQVGVGRPGREDVRLPRHGLVGESKDRPCPEEVSLELDLDSELLPAFALHPFDEVLARLDPAAGRPPDAFGKVRLSDQRQPVAVEHEQCHIVAPGRVVGDHRQLRVADVRVPVEERRLAELLPHFRQDSLVDVHYNRRRSSRSSSGPPTSRSAACPRSVGASSETTATRTATSSPSSERNASRSVSSSPAYSAR